MYDKSRAYIVLYCMYMYLILQIHSKPNQSYLLRYLFLAYSLSFMCLLCVHEEQEEMHFCNMSSQVYMSVPLLQSINRSISPGLSVEY